MGTWNRFFFFFLGGEVGGWGGKGKKTWNKFVFGNGKIN